MGINDRIIKRARELNGLSNMTPAQLQAWRSRMGWTAKEAAAQLGLSQNGYAAYERGYVERPSEPEWSMYRRGKRPIPRHVALACERLEQVQENCAGGQNEQQ